MGNEQLGFAKAAEEAVKKELRNGLWPVYERYLCDYTQDRFGPIGDRYIYAPPYLKGEEGGSVENKAVDKHAPLHAPALFLEFAMLAEEMDVPGISLRQDRLESLLALPEELNTGRNADVALDWTHRYGVLGLTAHSSAGSWWPDTRGGEGDTLKRFVYEAWTANTVLRLHTAATASPNPDVEAIQEILQVSGFRDPKQAKAEALAEVDEQVQSRLERHCFPQVYRRADGDVLLGYGFLSLLGAMWIQMGWLLAKSEKEIRRCLWCNKPILFEQGKPPANPGLKKNARGKPKTYKNKKFCSNGGKCKGLYHYYYRIKQK